MSDDVTAQVRARLAAGDKIGAIKIYRAATGLSLAEAKDAVEQMHSAASPMPVARPTIDAGTTAQVQALIAAGQVIEAIKLYRERTGLGLKEAKDAVDALARMTPPPPGSPPIDDAAGRVVVRPGGAGIGRVIALIAAAAIAAVLLVPALRRAILP